MSEHIVNRRIILKHDTADRWALAEYFIPFKGEVIIYDADLQETDVRFKIGDGIRTVNNLPFVNSKLPFLLNSNGGYQFGLEEDNLLSSAHHTIVSGLNSETGVRGLKIINNPATTYNAITKEIQIETDENAEELYDNVKINETRAALVLSKSSFDFYKVVSISGPIITLAQIDFDSNNSVSNVAPHEDTVNKNFIFLYNFYEKDNNGKALYGAECYDFSINNKCPPRPEVDFNYAFGLQSKAINVGSCSIGEGNLVNQSYGFAVGRQNISGYAAFTAGRRNKATGEYSSALNQATMALGTASCASGRDTIAKGTYSSAHNWGTQANGQASAAFGKYTTTDREAQMAVGVYNAPDGDALFVVGNGSENNKQNAFVVNDNGTAELQKQGDLKNSVVIKDTLDKTVSNQINNLDKTLSSKITKNTNSVTTETNKRKSSDLAINQEISDIIYGCENYYYTAEKPDSTENVKITNHSIEVLDITTAPQVDIPLSDTLNDFTLSFDLTTFDFNNKPTAVWNGFRPQILNKKGSTDKLTLMTMDGSITLGSLEVERSRRLGQPEHIVIRSQYQKDSGTTLISMSVDGVAATNISDKSKVYVVSGEYIAYLGMKFEFTNALVDNIVLVEGDKFWGKAADYIIYTGEQDTEYTHLVDGYNIVNKWRWKIEIKNSGKVELLGRRIDEVVTTGTGAGNKSQHQWTKASDDGGYYANGGGAKFPEFKCKNNEVISLPGELLTISPGFQTTSGNCWYWLENVANTGFNNSYLGRFTERAGLRGYPTVQVAGNLTVDNLNKIKTDLQIK